MSIHRKALSHLRRADPVLGRIIEEVGPCPLRPMTDGSHFEFIARSIIFQQLSTKAATTIHGRVLALCGGSMSAQALAQLPDDAIRSAGVSRQKLAYLRDLCARAADGTIDESRLPGLPDEEVIQHLVQVKGVGVWTAQMFLVFRLVRPDVLPVLDLGIRKGVQRAYGLRKLPDAKRVEKIGAPWAPYRTIGSWYMWRVLELETYRAPKKGRAA